MVPRGSLTQIHTNWHRQLLCNIVISFLIVTVSSQLVQYPLNPPQPPPPTHHHHHYIQTSIKGQSANITSSRKSGTKFFIPVPETLSFSSIRFHSRSLPEKRECNFQFPFPGSKKPFPLTLLCIKNCRKVWVGKGVGGGKGEVELRGNNSPIINY